MLEHMNATTIHLALELRQRDDCLSGHVIGEHGKATFSGWLGLISTLDALVGPDAAVEALQTIHAQQGEPAVSIIETPRGVRYLRGRLQGVILAQGEPGFDAARQAYNLTVEQAPALIALPADARDVVAIVDFAPRARHAGRTPADGAQRRAHGLARRRDPAQDRPAARASTSMPSVASRGWERA